MNIKINKSKLLKRSILVLLLLACIGIFVAHKFVQRYGFDGIGEFISVYSHNKELASQNEPQELQLKISDEDYDFLKRRRDVALERGIQINDGEDTYVECKIIQGADTVKGEMRLKGHMTDHLEGDKWSFRVKTNKKPVFGMTRFSLQAPGTRNYAYEWVYHQLLKEEEIIHLNYDFIRLKLNEKDLGIYAIEEHFGQHVLDHNDRPNGAILRWNPNLYWEGRIDELQGTYVDEQYSDYTSSFVEPYESGTVQDDPELVETYVKGASLLEEFRRGEKVTSEVFDVVKLARFHAIIDLVGGHHSLDWSDVKFFYNSETGKIEPVGYESFSVRKTEAIAGQRIPDEYDTFKFNYHDRLFSDPVFFAVYIQELERIADEEYLHNFIQKIQPDLDKKLGVLAHEFPYRKFSFDPYFENIELIRNNLELPKPFHAFLESSTDSTVVISVTPVSDFPIEIMSLSVDGKEPLKLDSAFILPAKVRNTYAHYFEIEVKHQAKKLKNLKLNARIPGGWFIFEVEVSDLPSYKNRSGYSVQFTDQSTETTSALIALNDSVSCFNTQNVVVEDGLIFGPGHSLKIFPGQHVHFTGDGKIITKGTIEMIGSDEEGGEIILSADSRDDSLTNPNEEWDAQDKKFSEEYIFIDGGELVATNVNFIGCNKLLFLLNSSASFSQCAFADNEENFVYAHKSSLIFTQCASGSVGSLGTFDQSVVRLKNFIAHKGDVFLTGFGSDFHILGSEISGYRLLAKLNHVSSLSMWSSTLEANHSIADINDASGVRIYGSKILGAEIAFTIDKETLLPGESSYTLYKVDCPGVKKMEERKKL